MIAKEVFEEIMNHAHLFNWAPDWQITKKIYETFPNSYSVLTPFAYSYLEELIRSTTSEYGIEVYDNERNSVKKRKVGMGLINLAILENREKLDFVKTLEEIKSYYFNSKLTDEGDNRHSVAHGYMHSRFWNQESFEKLVGDIARISKYSGF